MSEKTVLVIDDSATIRKLVDTHLSPAGYRVVLAPNAEDGLEAVTPPVESDLRLETLELEIGRSLIRMLDPSGVAAGL